MLCCYNIGFQHTKLDNKTNDLTYTRSSLDSKFIDLEYHQTLFKRLVDDTPSPETTKMADAREYLLTVDHDAVAATEIAKRTAYGKYSS